MQHSFLFKLYRYSKTGFFCCIVFLLLYLLFLLKNMDMMLFPHNSMFAAYAPDKSVHTYSLKINGRILPVTKKLWWKKDFLESNAAVYGKHYEEGGQTVLEHFITRRVTDSSLNKFLKNKLTAGKVAAPAWAKFYARMAGQPLQAGDAVEMVKYELKFKTDRAVIIDSFSIFNFHQP